MKTITEDNYVDQAQSVILSLQKKTDKRGKPIQLVTTSKLRNLLAMSADIWPVSPDSASNMDMQANPLLTFT